MKMKMMINIMLLNENLIWTDFYHITHSRLSKTISYLILVYNNKETAGPLPPPHLVYTQSGS